tara:strand:- start:53 stop:328 length:276 start_codon:yes stop_codon:yes gene_type:complete
MVAFVLISLIGSVSHAVSKNAGTGLTTRETATVQWFVQTKTQVVLASETSPIDYRLASRESNKFKIKQWKKQAKEDFLISWRNNTFYPTIY